MSVAMKLVPLLALAAGAGSAAGAVVRGAGSKVIVLPEDQEQCVAKMQEVIKKPVRKVNAIEKATDDCALDYKIDSRNFVCPHVRHLLTEAFTGFPNLGKMSAKQFCDISEFHVLRMRGTTRVPNIGSGSILDFKVGAECKPTVLGALQPRTDLGKSEVGDFWYSLCINQDCAHFLPSRTKWCRVDRMPTHGVEVCELAREFATKEMSNSAKEKLDAGELCGLYDKYVDVVKEDIEAYDHYVHGQSREHVPSPKDAPRSLQSSKLLNDAAAHYLRDNDGTPVKPHRSAASPVAATTALALALMALVA